MAYKGNIGFKSHLHARVIRSHPTLRQRFFDWLRSLVSL